MWTDDRFPLKESDINLFFNMSSRGANSKNNHIRELILVELSTRPYVWIYSPCYGNKWYKVYIEWKKVIEQICNTSIDDISVVLAGGRKNNYDFSLSYYDLNNKPVTRLIEFKFNCQSINRLPQFINLPEKFGLFKDLYAEFFYDNYLLRILRLINIDTLPPKDWYLNHVYTANYSCGKPFPQLKAIDANESTIQTLKSEIVNLSIKEYLALYVDTFDIPKLMDKIEQTQAGKAYILWYQDRFYIDYLKVPDGNVVNIANNNTVVIKDPTGAELRVLLRWKNHKGVLYPAYQISVRK